MHIFFFHFLAANHDYCSSSFGMVFDRCSLVLILKQDWAICWLHMNFIMLIHISSTSTERTRSKLLLPLIFLDNQSFCLLLLFNLTGNKHKYAAFRSFLYLCVQSITLYIHVVGLLYIIFFLDSFSSIIISLHNFHSKPSRLLWVNTTPSLLSWQAGHLPDNLAVKMRE